MLLFFREHIHTRDATIFGILPNRSIRPVRFNAQRQTTAFSVRFPVTKLFQNSVQPRMLCDPLRSRGMRAAHCLGSPSRTHFSSSVRQLTFEMFIRSRTLLDLFWRLGSDLTAPRGYVYMRYWGVMMKGISP